MHLQQHIRQQLSDLHAAKQGCPTRVALRETQSCVTLDVVELDSLAGEYQQLGLTRPAGSPRTVPLEKLATEIRQTVTYLSEPLRIVEFDRDAEVLQMRSTTPTHDGESRAYFECVLRPENLTLLRFQILPGGQPEPARMRLTHDTTARLVQDLDEILAR